MKALSEIQGSRLELRAVEAESKIPDVLSVWDQWAGEGPAVLLESAGPLGEANQWLIVAGEPEHEFFEKDGSIWWKDSDGTQPSPLGFWDFADQAAHVQPQFQPLPFCLSSAWFGVLSYDFGKRSNPRMVQREGGGEGHVPEFYFFKPSQVIAFDRRTRKIYCFGRGGRATSLMPVGSQKPFRVRGLKALMDASRYQSMARRAQEYISLGDIYQANLAQGFQSQWEGSAGTLYRILREMNPGPFMGLFQGRDFTVVSSSPERLVAGKGDWLETLPIAGTRPRGRDGLEDLQMKAELETNPKEQAEHLMLVDLARNDLGRVSRYGTVEVERYAQIESYARVHHLVSTVRSQRRPNALFSDVLRSLFPGGTITGCPKIRCMEIIEELEESPRGFYTGSMGYLAPGPCFDFNILIRSFTLFSNGLLEFKAGAGIVADSDPGREYLETLYKVEALAQTLGATLLEKGKQ